LDPFADIESVILSATFLVTILTAGLMGSIHCAGMCGPLSHLVSKSIWQNASYNFGRALGYITVGAVFGGMGEILLDSEIKWLRWGGALLTAIFIIFTLINIFTGRHLTLPIPAQLRSRFFNFAHNQGQILKAFYLGVLTTILPCGWLMTFAGAAAATGSAVSGAKVMAVFYLSTLPVMTLVPLKASKYMSYIKKRNPAAVALLIAVSSFLVLGLRFYTKHSCH